MLSRRAVLIRHEISPYSVTEIEEKYYDWVSEDSYMILNRIENNVVVLKKNEDGKYEIFKAPMEKKRFIGKIDGEYEILSPRLIE